MHLKQSILSSRFETLDSWRGVCALFVALFHFPFVGSFYALPFVRNSYLFVDFFFVLSGFVITHAYEARLSKNDVREDLSFVIRRVGRLWPLHVFVLAAFVALEICRLLVEGDAFNGGRSLSKIPSNLFLLHGLGYEQELSWNVPSWSVSVEFFLYLSFVVFCFLPARIRTATALCSVVVGVLVVGFFSPTYLGATVQFGLARGIAGFYAGSLAYRARRAWSPALGTWTEVAAAIIVIGFVSFAVEKGWRPLLSPLVFGVSVFIFSLESGRLSRLMRLSPAVAVGTWSYSIYMTHMFLISIFKIGADRLGRNVFSVDHDGLTSIYSTSAPIACDFLAIAFLGIVIFVAFLTYKCVEVPSRDLFNVWAKNVTSRKRAVLRARDASAR